MPRFAIAAYAAAICTGVTAMPWPIGTLPIVDPDHLSGGRTIPGLSPGKSMPVVRPKPKREIQEDKRVRPSVSASSIAPMFDECARICATE